MKDFLWHVFGQPLLKHALTIFGAWLIQQGIATQDQSTSLIGGALAAGTIGYHVYQAWSRHANNVTTTGEPLTKSSGK